MTKALDQNIQWIESTPHYTEACREAEENIKNDRTHGFTNVRDTEESVRTRAYELYSIACQMDPNYSSEVSDRSEKIDRTLLSSFLDRKGVFEDFADPQLLFDIETYPEDCQERVLRRKATIKNTIIETKKYIKAMLVDKQRDEDTIVLQDKLLKLQADIISFLGYLDFLRWRYMPARRELTPHEQDNADHEYAEFRRNCG